MDGADGEEDTQTRDLIIGITCGFVFTFYAVLLACFCNCSKAMKMGVCIGFFIRFIVSIFTRPVSRTSKS